MHLDEWPHHGLGPRAWRGGRVGARGRRRHQVGEGLALDHEVGGKDVVSDLERRLLTSPHREQRLAAAAVSAAKGGDADAKPAVGGFMRRVTSNPSLRGHLFAAGS